MNTCHHMHFVVDMYMLYTCTCTHVHVHCTCTCTAHLVKGNTVLVCARAFVKSLCAVMCIYVGEPPVCGGAPDGGDRLP